MMPKNLKKVKPKRAVQQSVSHNTHSNLSPPPAAAVNDDAAAEDRPRRYKKSRPTHPKSRGSAQSSARATTDRLAHDEPNSGGSNQGISTAVLEPNKEGSKGITPPHSPRNPRAIKHTLKAEQKVRLGNGRNVAIGGLSDELGNKYVWCRSGQILVITAYSDWHGGSADASNALRGAGLIVVGSIGDIREAVDSLKDFPPLPIVTKPGLSKYGFVLPDGQVLVPRGQPEPLKAFEPVSGMLGKAGMLEDWIERVAAPLADHKIPAFFMMMMFVAPLLRQTDRTDNLGFELFGEAGRGKSTLQALMASAAGPAIGGGDGMYWRTLNTTINALEAIMPLYNDLPLVLDEAGLVPGGGTSDKRALSMRDLAFRLSAGVIRQRLGEPAGPLSRLAYMVSTNVAIGSFDAAHGAESDAIADRLQTVPLLPDRAHGIFDYCPPSYPSSGAFADALKLAASQHYGYALPVFLQYLVNRIYRHPKKLRRIILEHVAKFLDKSGANSNDGSQKRVAEAFGLVYAAGRLAIEARVLPTTYKPGAAALAVYRLHRAHGRTAISFDDRLDTVLCHCSTIDLSRTGLATLSEAQRSACPAFLYTNKSKQRELIVPVPHIDTVFPGWKGIVKDPDVLKRLKRSSERYTRDRPVGRKGAQVPCYVFNVPNLQV